MSSSIEERIAEEVKAALLDQVLGVDGRVFRARKDAFSPDEGGDSINIDTAEMTSRAISEAVDDNELTLDVCLYVRGDVWESKADVYAVLVHPLLRQRNYLAAGLRIARVRRVEQDWAADEGDATPGKRTVKYAFRFLTLADDITAQP